MFHTLSVLNLKKQNSYQMEGLRTKTYRMGIYILICVTSGVHELKKYMKSLFNRLKKVFNELINNVNKIQLQLKIFWVCCRSEKPYDTGLILNGQS